MFSVLFHLSYLFEFATCRTRSFQKHYDVILYQEWINSGSECFFFYES